jgi:hypothetical protein
VEFGELVGVEGCFGAWGGTRGRAELSGDGGVAGDALLLGEELLVEFFYLQSVLQ